MVDERRMHAKGTGDTYFIRRRAALQASVNMGDIPDMMKLRHIKNCYISDRAYEKAVAGASGLSVENAMK